jgi:hypothetical protein
MTTSGQPGRDEAVFCQRHPDVETALTCGRCGTPICPRCMVHTPGGIRCPDCAQLRRPPMYELSASDYLKAGPTAVVAGALLGLVSALLLPPELTFGGFFGLLIAFFGGSAAGAAVGEVVQRATRAKRGLGMQAMVAVGLVFGYVVRLLIGGGLDLVVGDFAGLLAFAVAAGAAWSRLR